MKEASKAAKRRRRDKRYREWFKGIGIDIGSGDDPITSKQYPNAARIDPYDLVLGNLDAMTLPEIPDGTFDFVHSSNCLEHLVDPRQALENWLRVLKTGGHIICTVPDELLYEQGLWPSRFNSDHKASFTLRDRKFMPGTINIRELLGEFGDRVTIKELKLIDDGYDYRLNVVLKDAELVDQTLSHKGPECAIEFVVQKNS
jgi:SAM-dependent methyltransferase